MKTVVIKSDVLKSGNGCPVCGQHKTKRAHTCRPCITSIGTKATKAVKEVIFASQVAAEGHEAAKSTNTETNRGFLQKAVLANFRMPFGVKKVTKVPEGIDPYYHFGWNVKNGKFNISIFGAEESDCGNDVTVIAEVKRRSNDDLSVPYIRLQVVRGVKSNVRLLVKEKQTKNMVAFMPIINARGQIKKVGIPHIITGTIGYMLDENAVSSNINKAAEAVGAAQ